MQGTSGESISNVEKNMKKLPSAIETVAHYESKGIEYSRGFSKTYNGVEDLAKSLHTTLENGIMSHDIEKRKTAFGFKDNGAKDGWYEGDGIFVMASLIITVAVVMIHGLSYMATSFMNIGDAVYLSNERIFLLKVDFEKAFDSLDWKLLDNIMNQMGFSSKWRMWINGCLKSAYCSVHVNGSPTKEFKIQKSLRQGDPLSPFLFIIAVEALHIALEEAKSKHIFEGVKAGSNKVDISQL
ncbi:putative RNA-directed DNA polymerase, eukaryota, reverse transcriptase zinc-binding domain protein [Tanacetum coccineum]|uniref:RNA-directed DNA polymerase, eukaryota, reverse transcriptase zinc-binding domain protein n=1 Tax=Tanacetum coccineum TaxID=301880 RepID=A0ABQ4ZFA1_9ASTR